MRIVYGHPRREVLQRWQDAGAGTCRTDFSGAISFYLDGQTLTPKVAFSH
jgi:beta-lactamase superfamily II metal-dependent hydrolase